MKRVAISHVAIMVVLILVAIGIGGACGMTFTAKQGQNTFMSLKTSNPGKAVIKIDTKVACTVNAAGPIAIVNTCSAGEVPWYTNGTTVSCLPNPCIGGTALTHMPDGNVKCQ